MIYVASSWRNTDRLNEVVRALRGAGHEVYDFREDGGFSWSDIDPSIPGGIGVEANTSSRDYVEMVMHPIATAGFERDMKHLDEADTVVLVLPCGKSAHLELGYAIGQGKNTIIYLEDPMQPELMYRAANNMVTNIQELLAMVLWVEAE